MSTTRLDGLADDREAADLHVDAGLLEQLPAGGGNQGLPALDATSGKEPVAVPRLPVRDEEETVGHG